MCEMYGKIERHLEPGREECQMIKLRKLENNYIVD